MSHIEPSEQRFREAFSNSYADVVRFARRRILRADSFSRADPARAEDIAAETFLIAWRRIADLPTDSGDARAWLFGIARHCLLNDRRTAQRRDRLLIRLIDLDAAPPPPRDDTDAAILRVDLAVAWGRLTPGEQEVLGLVIFEGLTAAQVGTVLDLTPGAARVRLSRARAALRRELESSTTTRPAAQEVLR